jgi:hypothetical protein
MVIAVAVSNGKTHDFALFKHSGVRFVRKIKVKTDTGYLGIKKIHSNSEHPIKNSKLRKLTADDKRYNHTLSSERVVNEHAIGFLKRFRILAERYRNRRKRFGLRLNLLAGICNYELVG